MPFLIASATLPPASPQYSVAFLAASISNWIALNSSPCSLAAFAAFRNLEQLRELLDEDHQ